MAVLGVLHTPVAQAGNWTITPFVSAREIYTDNVNLSPEGQEQDDFITELSGGVSVRGTGARLQLNLDYSAQVLRYVNSDGGDSLNQQFQAGSNAELWEDIFFIDARASFSQQNVSSDGRLDNTNLALTGNQTDVLAVSIQPYVRHHFGHYADAEVRYGFDVVDNGSGASGSDATSISSRLTSGRKFSRMPWSVTTNRRKIDNDSGTSSEFQRIDGTLRYPIAREFGLVFGAGYEDNEFATSGGDTSGPSWSLGATWTPSERTALEAGYRERFFDPSFYFNFSHRARRMVFSASYSEDVTTTSQQQLNRQLIPLVDAFGDPIIDPLSGQQVQVPVDFVTLTDEVFVSRQLRGTAAYRGRRNSASVSVFSTISEFQLTGDEEVSFGVSGTASRQLSRHATLNVNGRWQDVDSRSGAGSTLWDVGTSLSYTLYQDVSGVVDFRHIARDSDVATGSYDENRISVRVNVTF